MKKLLFIILLFTFNSTFGQKKLIADETWLFRKNGKIILLTTNDKINNMISVKIHPISPCKEIYPNHIAYYYTIDRKLKKKIIKLLKTLSY